MCHPSTKMRKKNKKTTTVMQELFRFTLFFFFVCFFYSVSNLHLVKNRLNKVAWQPDWHHLATTGTCTNYNEHNAKQLVVKQTTKGKICLSNFVKPATTTEKIKKAAMISDGKNNCFLNRLIVSNKYTKHLLSTAS